MDLGSRFRRRSRTLARAASCPVTPLRNASPITGSSFASHCRTDSWLTVNPRRSKISLRSAVSAGSAAGRKHHERDDVARQRRPIEDTVTALVELLAAVPAPEPTTALRCQVWPLGHRRRATAYAIHRNPPSSGIRGEAIPCCQRRDMARGVAGTSAAPCRIIFAAAVAVRHPAPGVTPHCLRHYATRLIENGVRASGSCRSCSAAPASPPRPSTRSTWPRPPGVVDGLLDRLMTGL